jgi:hypothetical protein
MSGFKPYKPRKPGSEHDAISRAYHQAGGRDVVADILDRPRDWIAKSSDPDIDGHKQAKLTLREARVLSRLAGVTALAEDLALCAGGTFLPPMGAHTGADGALAAALGQATGEALAELFTALADGHLSPEEARHAVPKVRETVGAVSALYRRLMDVADGVATQTTPGPA